MIRQLPAPCWYVDHEPWEEPHFPTRAQAQAHEDRSARNDGCEPLPAQQHATPCWEVACDRCGQLVEDDEYGLAPHFATETDARTDSSSTCPACTGRTASPARRAVVVPLAVLLALLVGVLAAPAPAAAARSAPPGPDEPFHGVIVWSGAPPDCTAAERAELELRPGDTCEVIPEVDDPSQEWDGETPIWCLDWPDDPPQVRDARARICGDPSAPRWP